jgi:sigma-B regulation protein RsbU (phosphoserine phosphatase)
VARERATDAFQVALQADDPVALYERAPCGYLSTDLDGRIVKVNQTFLTLTGHDRDDLLARPLRDLLTPGGQIFEQTHLQPMLRMQGEVREIALDMVRGDGEVLPVLLNAMMDTTQGQVPMVRIAVFDATERRRYERELMSAKDRAEESERRARTLALTLQQTLMPASPPQIPGLDVAAAYRPSGDGTEVGGDFYDLFPVGNGTWAVLMGDVCGKGAEAAVVTALARNTVRALAVTHDGPAEVLSHLNEVVRRYESERYCTVVLATLRAEGPVWRVTISVGGHPPPLLVSGDTEPMALEAQGPLVGIFPGAEFADVERVLGPGQTLLFHTDGITEARGPDGYYGDERLHRRVAELGPVPQTLVDGVVAEAVAFQGSATRDDIAVVAVGVPPAV